MPAPPLINTFESGQPDGTIISVANSGGGAGNAFSSVTAIAIPTYSTTHAKSGTLSMRYDTTSVYESIHCDWLSLGQILTSIWVRFYLYLTANPVSTDLKLVAIKTDIGNSCYLALDTSGHLQVLNAAQTAFGTGAVSLKLNQWVRIEARFLSSTTVGEGEWWLYNAAESPIASYNDHSLVTSMVNGTNSDGIFWGACTAVGPNSFVGWMDDLALSKVSQIGPSGVPPDNPPTVIINSIQR